MIALQQARKANQQVHPMINLQKSNDDDNECAREDSVPSVTTNGGILTCETVSAVIPITNLDEGHLVPFTSAKPSSPFPSNLSVTSPDPCQDTNGDRLLCFEEETKDVGDESRFKSVTIDPDHSSNSLNETKANNNHDEMEPNNKKKRVQGVEEEEEDRKQISKRNAENISIFVSNNNNHRPKKKDRINHGMNRTKPDKNRTNRKKLLLSHYGDTKITTTNAANAKITNNNEHNEGLAPKATSFKNSKQLSKFKRSLIANNNSSLSLHKVFPLRISGK